MPVKTNFPMIFLLEVISIIIAIICTVHFLASGLAVFFASTFDTAQPVPIR
jgi:hypothetical protein